MSKGISLTPEELIILNEDINLLVNMLQSVGNVSNFAHKIFSVINTPTTNKLKSITEWINKFCDKKSWDKTLLQANVESLENFKNSISGLDATELNKQIEALHKINYSKLFTDLNDFDERFNSIISIAYEISQSYSTDKEYSEQERSETRFTSQREFVEALIEQRENPVGFQEKVANWAEDKKKKYYLIIFLSLFMWNNFVQPYFQQNIGVPVTAYIVSNVKDIPEKTGKVVCQLKKDIKAIIIEDTNYYYKVKFIDEDGIEKEGYVAKKNLKVIDSTKKED